MQLVCLPEINGLLANVPSKNEGKISVHKLSGPVVNVFPRLPRLVRLICEPILIRMLLFVMLWFFNAVGTEIESMLHLPN